jgi:hypothetical protein
MLGYADGKARLDLDAHIVGETKNSEKDRLLI